MAVPQGTTCSIKILRRRSTIYPAKTSTKSPTTRMPPQQPPSTASISTPPSTSSSRTPTPCLRTTARPNLGHDFWVLAYGDGKFDPEIDRQKYNLVNPIMKNTVAVHPYWTALRFVADNPGVWAFHCHIESHFYTGMGVVFEEGIDKVKKLPASIKG